MSDWKILVTDGLDESGLAILRQAAQVDDKSGISGEELLHIVGAYDAIIVRSRTRVSKAVFQATHRLTVVGRAGVGVDNIDLHAAKAHRVTVVNAPVSTSIAVAELALGMMLSLARAIPRANASMKAGQWVKSEFVGSELHGKVLGIVGLGNIGRALAARAAALGMHILGYDPFLPEGEISARGAQPANLAEVYARSDFISLHLPLTPKTRCMIDAKAMAQMKTGVNLVCTARGGLVDETALLEGLESGQVGGAALDVFAHEPPGLTDLVAHPRLIATPHIGAQTKEAQRRAAEDIASEVLAALRGESLRWKLS